MKARRIDLHIRRLTLDSPAASTLRPDALAGTIAAELGSWPGTDWTRQDIASSRRPPEMALARATAGAIAASLDAVSFSGPAKSGGGRHG